MLRNSIFSSPARTLGTAKRHTAAWGRFFAAGGAALILAVFGLLTAACEDPSGGPKKAVYLESIEVSKSPDKTVYAIGEKVLDRAGIRVTAYYSDKSTGIVDTNELEFSVFDSSIAGDILITVEWKGKTATFTITVGDAEEPNKEVASIGVMINPAKTAYTVGEPIDLTGLVLLVRYDDGTEGEIPYITLAAGGEFSFEPHTAGAVGGLSISIQYRGVQANFLVTVAAAGGGGPPALSGNASITPSSAKTGTQLTASFVGTGTVVYYQWKRDGISVGANSKFFTADTAGIYTVSVSGSKDGSNSISSSIASVYAMNGAPPIITSRNTADPSARVWQTDSGRLYLYPSTDRSPANNNRSSMDRYHVYSTDNMVDWIDHGEILRRDNLPVSASVGTATDGAWGPHHASAFFMAAPDAAYRAGVSGGRGPYFYYFPHALDNNGSVWTIGVAWSASPYGGFKNNVVRLKTSNGNYVQGDGNLNNPCVFQDGNDYYLVTGGNQQLYIARLGNDMVSLAETLTPYSGMSQLQHYREGPWMFTRTSGGIKKYYLMYSGNPSGGNDGDELLYAIGNGPTGPWAYQGAILDPSGTGSTSQGSVVEFRNKWYLFYHNARLSEGIGNLRSVCVNELSFNDDGTIRKVIQTAASVAQNGPNLNTGALNTQFGAGNYTVEVKYSEIEGGNYVPGFVFSETILAMNARVQVGGGATKQTNDIPAGAIHNLHNAGSYADFTGIAGNGGRAKILLSYALGGEGSASLQIRLNNGSPGTLSLPATDGWGTLATSNEFIINSMSGSNNTIRLSGAGVNIASMSVYLEEQ